MFEQKLLNLKCEWVCVCSGGARSEKCFIKFIINADTPADPLANHRPVDPNARRKISFFHFGLSVSKYARRTNEFVCFHFNHNINCCLLFSSCTSSPCHSKKINWLRARIDCECINENVFYYRFNILLQITHGNMSNGCSVAHCNTLWPFPSSQANEKCVTRFICTNWKQTMYLHESSRLLICNETS